MSSITHISYFFLYIMFGDDDMENVNEYRFEDCNTIKYKGQLFFKNDNGRYRSKFGKYKYRNIEDVVFEETNKCTILKGVRVGFRDGDYSNVDISNLFLTGRWKTRPTVTTCGDLFYLYYNGEVIAKSKYKEDLEKLSVLINGKKIKEIRNFVKNIVRENNKGKVKIID